MTTLKLPWGNCAGVIGEPAAVLLKSDYAEGTDMFVEGVAR